jgi:uncharacterized protein YeaO (DUF488 family)
MTRHQLRIKRVYKPPDDEDGVRVLVDRLWPRGLSREKAQIDLWLKEIHEPAAQSAVHSLLEQLTREPVTLLFAARDETRNNAVALKEWLDLQN